jgi:transcriptional regulator with XRE-family HTH domain
VSATTPSEAVAEEVRALMARHRISQATVADHLGISQSSMSRRLIGSHPFTVEEIYLLAGLFTVDPAQLVSVKAAS